MNFWSNFDSKTSKNGRKSHLLQQFSKVWPNNYFINCPNHSRVYHNAGILKFGFFGQILTKKTLKNGQKSHLLPQFQRYDLIIFFINCPNHSKGHHNASILNFWSNLSKNSQKHRKMDKKAIFCHSSQRYDLIIILSIVLTILECTTIPEF